MDKTRLVLVFIGVVPALLIVRIAAWIGFLLSFVLSLSTAPAQKPPPAPSLQSLATEDADFRACDRDWNTINGGSSGASPDSPEKASLENLAAPADDVRGADRDGCHVDDFWSAHGVERTPSLVEISAEETPD